MRWLLLPLFPMALAAQGIAPRPVTVLFSSRFQDPALTESSGAIRSRLLPHVLFTINDSGNPPDVFAFDSTGRPLGTWRVPGVANRDWEAISIGPCPTASCLFLADIGDNLERRDWVTVYRLREPASLLRFRGAADSTPLGLDSVRFRYPDHARDAEALWIGDDGSLLVVSKGRSDGVRLFRVPATGFGGDQVITAMLVQVLPIAPDQRLGRWVTDAARSPDERRVAIRTYTEVYFFPRLSGDRLGTPTACNVAGLEPQGEGLDWLDDRRLLLTSERVGQHPHDTIRLVECPGA